MLGGGPAPPGVSNYAHNIRRWRRASRVLVPDLPGYSQSSKTVDPPTLRRPGGAMLGLLDALDIPRPKVVGNSSAAPARCAWRWSSRRASGAWC